MSKTHCNKHFQKEIEEGVNKFHYIPIFVNYDLVYLERWTVERKFERWGRYAVRRGDTILYVEEVHSPEEAVIHELAELEQGIKHLLAVKQAYINLRENGYADEQGMS